MPYQEKSAWILLLASLLSYGWYVTTVLGSLAGAPLQAAAYQAPLLWSIGVSLVAVIVLHILAAIVVPGGTGKMDQRDRDIYRLSEYTGQSFVVIGALAAMAMALAAWHPFWIANVIYLCFMLAAVLSTITRIALYRFGFHPW
ncbi:hypothetical protein [Devosia sp. FKR38]|uniref:hypothetical protein n=1 Tax=Devosia sp. FKR38 TaxID=2562312 RepID=UPI0020BF4F5D|nr:hypothetical protein [Devosia sp. FKR38]